MGSLVAGCALVPILLLANVLNLIGKNIFTAAGVAFGDFLRLAGFRTKIVRANLQLALGEEISAETLQALEKKIYRNIGTVFLEIARNFSFSAERMRQEVQIDPACRAKIDSILSQGKGAVFISGHLANWELFAMGMAAHGYPVMIVVKKMNNPVSQALIERQRLKTGLGVIYSGGTIEKMKAELKNGKAIGFMLDQNTTGKKGIRANFFGVPASSIRGLAGLVRETGAPVVPICAVRGADGKHFVRLLEPLAYLKAGELPEGSPERAAREEWLNTQQYQGAVEELVRKQPEQWLWIHRRWKANRTKFIPGHEHLENIPKS